MDACEVSGSAPMDAGARRKRNWAFVLVAGFAALSVGAIATNRLYAYWVAYIWFGFIYGMCLQYGRFCFSSAFRDLFAVGVPRMIVGIVIATVLFGISASFLTTTGMSAFKAGPFTPYGISSIIAGIVFGVGMTFSGGCASSSLYKTGEGNSISFIVLMSISATQAAFVDIGGWLNKLVPTSWHESAASHVKAGPLGTIDPSKGGWFDQYLTGFAWNYKPRHFAELLGFKNLDPFGYRVSAAGAFIGDFFVGVVIPATIMLAIVYVFWSRKGFLKKWKREKKVKTTGFGADLKGFWNMVASSKRTAIAGLILGVAAGLHMFVMKGLRLKFGIENAAQILTATGHTFGIAASGEVYDPGYWYVTTQEAQWFGWLFNKLGWNNMQSIFFGWREGIPNPIFNFAGWMSISLIGGSAVMALLHNEWKFKKPTFELASWAVIGGFLMGIGARLGLGCNIGAFFARTANGDVSGWFFGIGMTGGAYIGVRFFKWWTERKMAQQEVGVPDLQL